MTLHKTTGTFNTIIALTILMFFSLNVQAKQKRFLYYSFKTGSYLSNIPDYSESGTPLGIQLGYDYGSDWSLDLEFINDTLTVKKQGLTAKVKLDMWGLYATYRYPTKLYYLVRLGGTHKQIEDPHNGTATLFSDYEFSYGIGGGFRFNGQYSMEVEYTRSKDDLALLGLTFRSYFDTHKATYEQ